MKNKLRLFSILIIFILFLVPFNRVKAATQYMYKIPLTRFIPQEPTGWQYNIGGNNSYNFNRGGNFIFHGILDNSNYYLAYCLSDGLSSPNNGSGNINTGFSGLVNKYGYAITPAQQEILKNVLAVGPQYRGTNLSQYFDSAETQTLQRIFVTQIIVWEIMDGARYDYSNNLNSNAPNTYQFVQNVGLVDVYREILDDAYYLTGAKDPSTFNKTYIMHWSDAQNTYISTSIDIGRYSVSSFDSGLNVEKTNNIIVVSSKNEIDSPQDVNFVFLRGNSLDDAKQFRWFRFGASGKQDIALAYHQQSRSRKLSVKTESGKFKITKKDSVTKADIVGASFDIYKCNDSNCTSRTKVNTADLTNKAVSDDITIKKSGKYLFREVKTPFSYEKVGDFYVNFTIDDEGKIKAESNANFLEIQSATDSNPVLNLIIKNDAKEFRISKIDGKSKQAINGATFQIKNSNGDIVKFNNINGVYRYSETGTITNLVNASSSSYRISKLPAGEYSLVEVNVPYPYVLPANEVDKEVKIKIDNEYNLYVYNNNSKKYEISSNATVTVKNYITTVVMQKTGNGAQPLSGVVFELYDSNKVNQISLKSLGNGAYEYNPSSTTLTQLITNQSGKITISYLPEGTYYFKEVKTVDGYVIDPSVEWKKVEVSVTGNNPGVPIQAKITNAKGEFCFYKIDEDGNYLNDGLFKLQVYSESTSRFEDTPLIFNDSNKTYTIDTTGKSDIYTFTPISEGQTCFTNMNSKGRYRVVEIEAPDGFILPSVSETNAEIIINENGYAIGDAVIINKKITIGEGAEAQAELVINISTGQDRIHYIIIISILLIIITGLIILSKKINKK